VLCLRIAPWSDFCFLRCRAKLVGVPDLLRGITYGFIRPSGYPPPSGYSPSSGYSPVPAFFRHGYNSRYFHALMAQCWVLGTSHQRTSAVFFTWVRYSNSRLCQWLERSMWSWRIPFEGFTRIASLPVVWWFRLSETPRITMQRSRLLRLWWKPSFH
jgi:hypothetical protein